MKVISWNCQGIGSPLTVEALKELRKSYDPQFLFLMETKNKEEKLEMLRRRNGFEKGVYVEPEGLSGGLAVWWKGQDEVKILGTCKNLIDMEIEEEGSGKQCRAFWVYGPTDFEERQEVWKLMWEKRRNIEIPWLCVGDFNDILYEYEKEGGKRRAAKKIKGFRQMVENCKLIDLQFKG